MKPFLIQRSLLLLFLLVVSSGCTSGSSSDSVNIQASGFIEGRIYSVSSGAGGRIEEVSVELGERVLADQILVTLDGTQLELARDQARAGVDAAEAELAAVDERPTSQELTEVQIAIKIAEAELESAKASLELLKANYLTSEPPSSERHAAEYAVEIAEAGLALAEAQAAQVEAGAQEGQRKIAQASLAEAKAQLTLAERQLEELTLRSPIEGIVNQVFKKESEIASPGSALLAILDPNHLTLTVYVPTEKVAKVSLGMDAEIRTDSLPDEVFHGSVTQIADEAQFTPTNVQTQEERVKLVFAVRIRVDDPEGKLTMGMPADVEIIVE